MKLVDTPQDLVRHMLTHIGEDPHREGLLETPGRVVAAWDEWFSGYKQDPSTILKTFKDGAELVSGDELVLVANIEFYSFCEHHMAPFFGHAHVGYIPNGSVVGLSKFARLVDCFAKRLQVQERLTNQIANAVEVALMPLGVGVVLTASHHCMCSRGVNKQHSATLSSALRGAMKDNPATRAEFFHAITLATK